MRFRWRVGFASFAATMLVITSGVFSEPALAVPPSAPGPLTGTAISYSQVNLAWQDNSFDETGFKIERNSGSGFVEITTIAASRNFPVGIGGRTQVRIMGSPDLATLCSYNSAGTSADNFSTQCASDLVPPSQPLIGTSGALQCSGSGWSYVPTVGWPPSASTSVCTNFVIAPSPNPWGTVPIPTDAMPCPDSGVVTTATISAGKLVPGGHYTCTNLTLGTGSGMNLCLDPAAFTQANGVEFYVTGDLHIGSGAAINIGRGTSADHSVNDGTKCPGSPRGPALDVTGSDWSFPTSQAGALRVYGSGTGQVIPDGSSIYAAEAAAVIYGPNMTYAPSAGPRVRVFGSIMVNNYIFNGAFRGLPYDTALSTSTFSDIGLTPNTQYVYRIRSTNGSEDSAYSNEVTVTTLASLSGNIAGGSNGSISVYDSAGTVAAYSCCMTSDFWQVDVPPSTCPSGGYRVLWQPADSSKSPTWYSAKQTYAGADCVTSPSMNNNMSATASSSLSGYVKDLATASDIDGAVAYAFDATSGTFVGWSQSGDEGPGRFRISVPGAGPYKVRVVAPTGHSGSWYDGSTNYSDASPVVGPASDVNFSLPSSGVIDGYVKDANTAADLNGYPVYAYTTAGQFYGYGVTDRGYGTGRYRIEAAPGEQFKLIAGGGSTYSNQWYSGATGFSDATATSAPFTANFSLN